ncbi:MAG: Trk system potassium transporter TrkA [Bacteroidales bacterium]
MNIIIAGDGEVGFHMAKMLSDVKHNITVVDPHRDLLELVEASNDLLAITGDSTSIKILEKADVKHADLVLSVLHDEQINIVTCILAKKLGASRAIARVNNPEYLTKENKALFNAIGVDAIVSPESIAAREIINLLHHSAMGETFDFSQGKLSFFMIPLDNKAKVIGKTLTKINSEYGSLGFRAVAIHREGHTIIPRGEDEFQEYDMAYVISKPDWIGKVMELAGKESIKVRKAMIIGGGRIGRFTAKQMENEITIKLIDYDKDRCESLYETLDETLIINGDAREIELLEEEGIKNMDAFVAVTNDSETNILTSLLAKRMGVKKVIALVENIEYINIAQSIGIETIINKKLITASYITRFTYDAEVANLKCLSGINAEVLEFVVKPDAKATKKPVKQLQFPKNAIIGGIIRGNEGLIATGDLQIQAKDRVVVFALPEAIHKLNRFFN